MSTFDGVVREFPDIRIDYFRHHPGRLPPAACFLSHIHSDHLLGLESLKMPFVYCSAATRRLLLNMEKYPHRVNFSKGILEARKQTYKHLKPILRPLPLQTPVVIELRPKSRIRVTLFDANHCPGAVMFLIDGDSRAILYTGDIRAEPWWVNSIVRSPALIPFATGHRRLDCIYLDTTFASHQDVHRHFPTKAEGLTELIAKVSKCSAESVFYFRAWTLGYEDVWKMLNSVLASQIHVDQYQMRLFRGVAEDGLGAEPGPALVGFQVGNGEQPGCLTIDQNTRIHSCDLGMPCYAGLRTNKHVVWITPIISRLQDGTEVAEVGAGGGAGDLYQTPEIDVGNDAIIDALRNSCASLATDQEAASRLETALTKAQYRHQHQRVLDGLGCGPETEITIKDFLNMLAEKDRQHFDEPQQSGRHTGNSWNVIHFPYSRHSSYSELRHLVESFKPLDIYPCTVDLESWTDSLSMASLFGDLCSDNTFKYDRQIRGEVQMRRGQSGTRATPSQVQVDSQRTETTSSDSKSSTFQRSLKPTRKPQGEEVPLNGDTIAAEIQSPTTVREQRRDVWRAATDGQDTCQASTEIVLGVNKQTAIDVDADRLTQIHRPRTPDIQENEAMRERLRNAWREANNGHDTYSSTQSANHTGDELPSTPIGRVIQAPGVSSRSTIDTGEEFESPDPPQTQIIDRTPPTTQVGGTYESPDLLDPDIETENEPCNLLRRKRAFDAARICLETGDDTAWRGLKIRCLGWEGHTQNEHEL